MAQAPYTGAVQIVPANKFGEAPSILDFVSEDTRSGIRRSIITDDISANVQGALDAIASRGGGNVFVPAGLYPIVDIDIPDKVFLVGEGKSSLFTRHGDTPTGRGMINIASLYSGVSDIGIDGGVTTPVGMQYNVDFTGVGSNDPMADSLTENTSIWVAPGARGVKLVRPHIEHTGGYAILIDARDGDIFDVDVDSPTIRNCRPHLFGISSGALNFGSWTGGIHYQCDGRASASKLYSVKGLRIIGAMIERITGAGIWGHSYGFDSMHTGVHLISNLLRDIGFHGVQLGNVNGGSVVGNNLRRVGYITTSDGSASIPKYLSNLYASAIDMAGLVKHANISSNTVVSANGDCMDLDGLCYSNVIGNTLAIPLVGEPEYDEDSIDIIGPSDDGTNSTYGIQTGNTNLLEGGSYINISDNTIRNMGQGGLRLYAFRHGKATNNRVYHSDGAGLQYPIVIGPTGVSASQRAFDNVLAGNVIHYDPTGSPLPAIYEDNQLADFDPSEKNWYYNNRTFGNCFGLSKDADSGSVEGSLYNTLAAAPTVESAHLIQREGIASDDTSALKWYLQENGSAWSHMQLQGYWATGQRGPLLNVSEAGTGGVIATGAFTTSSFNHAVLTGKIYMDGFMASSWNASNSPENAAHNHYAEANTLPASAALLYWNGALGKWRQSISVSLGVRVWSDFGGGSATPGGSNTQVQFNDSGVLGGTADFTFDKTNKVVTITGVSSTAALAVATGYIQSNAGVLSTLTGYQSFYAYSGGFFGESANIVHYIAMASQSTPTKTTGDDWSSGPGVVYYDTASGSHFWRFKYGTGTSTLADANLSAQGYYASGSASNAIQAPAGGVSALGVAATDTATNALQAPNGGVTAKWLISTDSVFFVEETAPAVSAAGQSRLYMDSTTHAIMVSMNGSAYTALLTGTNYWQRSGTTLSPLNAGDLITTSGSISSSATGASICFQAGGGNLQISGAGNISSVGTLALSGTGSGINVSGASGASTNYNAIQVSGGGGMYARSFTALRYIQAGTNSGTPSATAGDSFNSGAIYWDTAATVLKVYDGSTWLTVSTGTVTNYWQRSGTTLSPVTAGDSVATSGIFNSTATGASLCFQGGGGNFQVSGAGNVSGAGSANFVSGYKVNGVDAIDGSNQFVGAAVKTAGNIGAGDTTIALGKLSVSGSNGYAYTPANMRAVARFRADANGAILFGTDSAPNTSGLSRAIYWSYDAEDFGLSRFKDDESVGPVHDFYINAAGKVFVATTTDDSSGSKFQVNGIISAATGYTTSGYFNSTATGATVCFQGGGGNVQIAGSGNISTVGTLTLSGTGSSINVSGASGASINYNAIQVSGGGGMYARSFTSLKYIQAGTNSGAPIATAGDSFNGGALYWDTAATVLKVYDGSTWLTVSTGTVTNYWQRSGTTLSPVTPGDNITTSGTISSSATGATICFQGGGGNVQIAGSGNISTVGTLALSGTGSGINVSGASGASINYNAIQVSGGGGMYARSFTALKYIQAGTNSGTPSVTAGDSFNAGAMFWDTAATVLKVYDGFTWLTVYTGTPTNYWQRSGTTLSPVTAGDSIATSGLFNSTATGSSLCFQGGGGNFQVSGAGNVSGAGVANFVSGYSVNSSASINSSNEFVGAAIKTSGSAGIGDTVVAKGKLSVNGNVGLVYTPYNIATCARFSTGANSAILFGTGLGGNISGITRGFFWSYFTEDFGITRYTDDESAGPAHDFYINASGKVFVATTSDDSSGSKFQVNGLVSASTGYTTSGYFNSSATGATVCFQGGGGNVQIAGSGNISSVGTISLSGTGSGINVSGTSGASINYNAIQVSGGGGMYARSFTALKYIQAGSNSGTPSATAGDSFNAGAMFWDTGATALKVYNGSTWLTVSTGTATNYWQRSGTTLSPLTAGDSIATSGVINSTATGASICFQGGGGNFQVDGNGNVSAAGSINASGAAAYRVAGTTIVDSSRNATFVTQVISNTSGGNHLTISSVAPAITLTDGSARNAVIGLATTAGHFDLSSGDTVIAAYGNSRGHIYINANYSGTGTTNVIVQPSSGLVLIRASADDGSGAALQSASSASITGTIQAVQSGASIAFKTANNNFAVDGNGNLSIAASFNSAGSTPYKVNGTTIVDSSRNLSNIAALTLSGAISGGTSWTGSGSVNTTAGGFQINGTTVIDSSRNITNATAITASSTIQTTLSSGVAFQAGSGNFQAYANGNINGLNINCSSSGSFQVNGTTFVNSSIDGTFRSVTTSSSTIGVIQSACTSTNIAFQTTNFNFQVNGNGVVACQQVNVAGSTAINSSNQFVGSGVLCGSSGIGGGAFNPWNGSGYDTGSSGTITIASTASITVSGGVITGWTPSDSAVKELVRDQISGLDVVRLLRPVVYRFNALAQDLYKADMTKQHLGFFADKVAEIMPEACEMNAHGHWTYSDRAIMGALVNAIKQLDSRLDSIESNLRAI